MKKDPSNDGVLPIGSLPRRDEIDRRYLWKLEDIYSSSESWEKDFYHLEEMLPRFSEFRGALHLSASTLLGGLRLMEDAEIIMGKLYAYAVMRSHEDMANKAAQALAERAELLLVKLSAAVSFYTPEILEMDEIKIREFMEEEKELQIYRFFFEDLMRSRPHTLSPVEEELLARSGEIARAPENIFSLFTNADIKFPTVTDEDGNAIELSEERYIRLIRSQNRNVRHEAYEGLFRTYDQYQNSLAAMYGASVKGDIFYSQSRKYSNSLEAALHPDNISSSVYDMVVDTVRDNLEPLHEYVQLRKEVLALPELAMCDLYVPLVDEPQKEISYEDACNVVLDGLRPLGEEYVSILKEGFLSGWIDVYENEGKRKGAYSWGSYGTHPYVLLNYNGTIHDMFTIAHEMGHAIHTWYSHKHQPYVYADYTIFLAEVASTTNEALLLQFLLKNSRKDAERRYLLNYSLEQIRTTVYRQAMFADFEKMTHSMMEKGEPLTADRLSNIWHELNEAYYGSHISVDHLIDIEWARIPHFYSAFYVYKYVTGYAAATSLSQKILREGKDAQRQYIEFLKKGRSAYSLNILNEAGVNMTTSQPLLDTIALFKKNLMEMKSLL
ncbi:MAG TPA: oligoendopeptidase F [Aminobacterium sp.]|nr:oligoendopeptidase F [Aminobacterium sp.]